MTKENKQIETEFLAKLHLKFCSYFELNFQNFYHSIFKPEKRLREFNYDEFLLEQLRDD